MKSQKKEKEINREKEKEEKLEETEPATIEVKKEQNKIKNENKIFFFTDNYKKNYIFLTNPTENGRDHEATNL